MTIYVYHNLTTNETTSDPAVALAWWKRGHELRCTREEV